MAAKAAASASLARSRSSAAAGSWSGRSANVSIALPSNTDDRSIGGAASRRLTRPGSGRSGENVNTVERHADYGYDAPYALVAFTLIGTLGAAGAFAAWAIGRTPIAIALVPYGAFFLGNALSFFYTT